MVALFLLTSAIYFALSLGLPADPSALQKYHLTATKLHVLSLTILLPLLIIYLSALYGFIKIRNYAKSVVETAEGPGFTTIANGLGVLAFSLPLNAAAGALLNYVAYKNVHLLPTVTIVKNYLALIFAFVSLLIIAQGANKLVATLKHTGQFKQPKFSLLGAIILSSLFVWLITSRQFGPQGESTYYLPNWLIITTLAIPYLYAWCKGIAATYNLYHYQFKVKGIVYRRAINYLALGVGVIIFLSILIQGISTFSARLSKLNLTPLLLFVYALVALYIVGFGILVRAAYKLKQIEEV